jgi:signal recognition particle GTPase
MPQPGDQHQPGALTLEQFIQLAAKSSYVGDVRSKLATLLATLIPLPALRRRASRVRHERDTQKNAVRRLYAIYAAMTPAERGDPGLVDHPRRAAIAAAAGVEPMDVSQLRRSFEAVNRALSGVVR